MPVNQSDLKFYLTSSEPLISQNNPSQSVGGYPSLSEINPSYALTTAFGPYSNSFSINKTIPEPFAMLVGDEIITVDSISASTVLVAERHALSTGTRYHPLSDNVSVIKHNNLFNNSISQNNKQYRCLAVTNNGTGVFSEIKFYFKRSSLNAVSSLKLAVEIPSTEIVTGTATKGSTISLVDSSVINAYGSELEGCVLIITSGNNINLGRPIASFSPESGTFTFRTAFPTAIEGGVTYRIQQAPCQRKTSGILPPNFGTTNVTNLSTAAGYFNGLGINVSGTRTHGVNLYPNETVYLWIERNITAEKNEKQDNRVILTASYK